MERKHIRRVYETSERPDEKDLEKLKNAKKLLKDLMPIEDLSEKLWYNVSGGMEIFIIEGSEVKPLSSYSKIVKNIGGIHQIRLYVSYENRDEAEQMLRAEGFYDKK
ncbi:MAG: hypothetical protein EFT35_02460 [Methanophagales archaeon ANME-1-THS]|nr:MAG: hypothetical protein EFT35_02460 [Methanophagales archaeon ANME-1-THS]